MPTPMLADGRIFVVDDDERDRQLMSRILTGAGYGSVRTFTDPRGARRPGAHLPGPHPVGPAPGGPRQHPLHAAAPHADDTVGLRAGHRAHDRRVASRAAPGPRGRRQRVRHQAHRGRRAPAPRPQPARDPVLPPGAQEHERGPRQRAARPDAHRRSAGRRLRSPSARDPPDHRSGRTHDGLPTHRRARHRQDRGRGGARTVRLRAATGTGSVVRRRGVRRSGCRARALGGRGRGAAAPGHRSGLRARGERLALDDVHGPVRRAHRIAAPRSDGLRGHRTPADRRLRRARRRCGRSARGVRCSWWTTRVPDSPACGTSSGSSRT